MVGKPNLPDTGDGRPDLRGAARATPGFAALDEEREASMADEGGASGATMESEDVSAPPNFGAPPTARRRRAGVFFFGAAAGMLAVMAATNAIRRRAQNPERDS